MFQIESGIKGGALKVVIYGPEGIGKTTMASEFPVPVFIDTEDSTKFMAVSRLPKPSSWAMLMQEVAQVRDMPGGFQTLVVDTADWTESLCSESICAASGKTGIEDFGYGKGYIYLVEEFGKFLNLLTEVVERGVNVVLCAHSAMRKFEQPDEMGAYDRWELKLSKKTAPLVKEWADLVLFANYKTIVVNVDGQGSDKGKNKVQGGRRVMYTSHHPCWDAKNRHGLPDELPFGFEGIAHLFSTPTPTLISQVEQQEAPPREPPIEEQTEVPPRSEERHTMRQLRDMMRSANIDPFLVEAAVSSQGHFPKDTPIENFPDEYITGFLLPNWSHVLAWISENRHKIEPLPF